MQAPLLGGQLTVFGGGTAQGATHAVNDFVVTAAAKAQALDSDGHLLAVIVDNPLPDDQEH